MFYPGLGLTLVLSHSPPHQAPLVLDTVLTIRHLPPTEAWMPTCAVHFGPFAVLDGNIIPGRGKQRVQKRSPEPTALLKPLTSLTAICPLPPQALHDGCGGGRGRGGTFKCLILCLWSEHTTTVPSSRARCEAHQEPVRAVYQQR